MIKIGPVRLAAKSDLADINGLLRQLSNSARKLDMKTYRRLLSGKNYFLFAARDSRRIIGMASLVLMEIPVAFRSRLEDLVVDEKYRGQGLGEKLSRVVIIAAKKKGAVSVDLTTSPSRGNAYKLYEKLGFEKRNTLVYRLNIRK